VSAVDVRHCVVEKSVDREGQGMVMRVLKQLLVFVPTKVLFFFIALTYLLIVPVVWSRILLFVL